MLKGLLLLFIKYAPPVFVVLIPALIVYGSLNPWPPAKEAILDQPNEVAFLIGSSSSYKGDYEKHTKSYLVLNTDEVTSEVVSLTIDTDGFREIKKREGELLNLLFVYSLFLLATWWFWIKPLQITKPSTGQRP